MLHTDEINGFLAKDFSSLANHNPINDEVSEDKKRRSLVTDFLNIVNLALANDNNLLALKTKLEEEEYQARNDKSVNTPLKKLLDIVAKNEAFPRESINVYRLSFPQLSKDREDYKKYGEKCKQLVELLNPSNKKITKPIDPPVKDGKRLDLKTLQEDMGLLQKLTTCVAAVGEREILSENFGTDRSGKPVTWEQTISKVIERIFANPQLTIVASKNPILLADAADCFFKLKRVGFNLDPFIPSEMEPTIQISLAKAELNAIIRESTERNTHFFNFFSDNTKNLKALKKAQNNIPHINQIDDVIAAITSLTKDYQKREGFLFDVANYLKSFWAKIWGEEYLEAPPSTIQQLQQLQSFLSINQPSIQAEDSLESDFNSSDMPNL